MTREEQIISEAKKHYYDSINCHNAFLHGVEWADEHPANVWHDASEEPKPTSTIVYEIRDGKVTVYGCIATTQNVCWDRLVNRWTIVRWAYISDLLPKGGEK